MDFSTVSFGDLLNIQQKVGDKKFSSIYHSKETKENKQETAHSLQKRQNKKAPVEVSSKRPVSRIRDVLPEKKARDPRFEPFSGSLDKNKIQQTYGFLKDYRKSELQEMKQKIIQEKDESLIDEYKRAQSQLETSQNKERLQQLKRDWNKQQLQGIKQGKKPYFLKRAELKKMDLTAKYHALGKKVDKYLEKKRKRKASKELKSLPFIRRSN